MGVNSSRSSYATYLDKDRMTIREKDEIAKKMRTSRKYLDLNYIKILPNALTPTQTQTEMAIVSSSDARPTEFNAHQK